MNTFATSAFRDLTCGAAATLITLVLGMSFVTVDRSSPRRPCPGGAPASDCRRTTPGSASLNRPFW